MPEFMQQVIRERVPPFLDGDNIVGLRLDEFSVDGDGNIITHQKTACLRRGIRRKAVVLYD
jgi:hypothetical protein